MISWRNRLGVDQLPLGYLADVATWRLHRRTGAWSWPNFPLRQPRQAILIHEPDSLCLTQIFPFYYYRSEIERRYNLRLSFQLKDDFLARPERSLRNAALVLLQSWYTTPDNILNELLLSAKTVNPDAKVVFLDAMSPTDLRLARVLGDKIDLYVKKHVLKNRSLYGKPTRGDTNLSDFYMKQYGISAPETKHEISQSFLDKIIVGPSFFTSPRLFGHFKFIPRADHDNKLFDVHARLTYAKDDWYGVMRQESKTKLEQIKNAKILSEPGAPVRQYFAELRASKMCFSPFGYGEGCHRDYESIYAGSLLLKPNMGHIETNPDIFIAHETYVPLDWRFGDLDEKVHYYLVHDSDRRRMVDNAYGVLHKYCRSDYFLDQMKPVFDLS